MSVMNRKLKIFILILNRSEASAFANFLALAEAFFLSDIEINILNKFEGF